MPFLLLMFITCVKAHGDLDLRIKVITSAIESYPDSAVLYFKRGKLRFQHEEYKASIEDVHTSLQKGFHDELQKIYLAKSFFKLNNFEEANSNLDQYLNQNPENVVGLKLKARILYGQEKFVESAQHFEKVIQLTIKSLPENYLEAAHSWQASSDPYKMTNSIHILELGLKNLGPIITIQNKLIDAHLIAVNREQALELQFAIIKKTNRKESAYFKLAEIYLQLEESENAIEAVQNSKKHWEKLPSRIQNNSAMKLLKNEIEQILTKTH